MNKLLRFMPIYYWVVAILLLSVGVMYCNNTMFATHGSKVAFTILGLVIILVSAMIAVLAQFVVSDYARKASLVEAALMIALCCTFILHICHLTDKYAVDEILAINEKNKKEGSQQANGLVETLTEFVKADKAATDSHTKAINSTTQLVKEARKNGKKPNIKVPEFKETKPIDIDKVLDVYTPKTIEDKDLNYISVHKYWAPKIRIANFIELIIAVMGAAWLLIGLKSNLDKNQDDVPDEEQPNP